VSGAVTLGTMTIDVRRRAWTTDEYHRMGETGLLGEDDRVELIEGEILEMSPIGARHNRVVNKLNALLVPPLTGRAIVQIQGSFHLSNLSEPQPDVLLLRWRDDFYPELPGPQDVLLVVEVADTTLAFDRAVKLPAYARAGIAVAWLVDLIDGSIEVCTGPSGDGYTDSERRIAGDTLAVPGVSDVVVAVADIVG